MQWASSGLSLSGLPILMSMVSCWLERKKWWICYFNSFLSFFFEFFCVWWVVGLKEKNVFRSYFNIFLIFFFKFFFSSSFFFFGVFFFFFFFFLSFFFFFEFFLCMVSCWLERKKMCVDVTSIVLSFFEFFVYGELLAWEKKMCVDVTSIVFFFFFFFFFFCVCVCIVSCWLERKKCV